MISPVYLDVFPVKKEVLGEIKTIASIDRGCSLTKVLYVPKKTAESSASDMVLLHCATFMNADFEKGLEYLKEIAEVHEGDTLHVTGAGCHMYKQTIEDVLKMNVIFIDEFVSQFKGMHFLIKNVDPKELYFKTTKYAPYCADHLTGIERLIHQEIISNFGTSDDKTNFPMLFVFLGSGAGMIEVFEDGRGALIGGSAVGGKTFLGLSKCLLDTRHYGEIMDLAQKGKESIECKHLKGVHLADGETVTSIDEFTPETKEETAFFINQLAAKVITSTMIDLCRTSKIRNVVIGGNMARGQVLQDCMLDAINKLGVQDILDVKFLKTGHTGAIGALITNPENIMQHFHVDS